MTTLIKTDVGKYTIQEGDDFQSISRKLYGTVRKAAAVAKAHGRPELDPGDVIDIPGFTGTIVQIEADEGVTGLHRRVFRTRLDAGVVKEFERWNGKDFSEGDWVFFVNTRRISYGY